MSRPLAKICGLSTAATVDAAVAGGAAWLGFVFFPPSPRHVEPDLAGGLIARAPAHVGRVGVFVDPDDALVERAVAAGITAVQLHGREPPARAAALRTRFGIEVWKAVPVRSRADLQEVAQYRGAADRILYDAKPPAGAALPGGMGLRFDWRLLDGFAHPLPWLLSGGLDAGSLAEAVGVTGARTVAVSSGGEEAPGGPSVATIAAVRHAAAPA